MGNPCTDETTCGFYTAVCDVEDCDFRNHGWINEFKARMILYYHRKDVHPKLRSAKPV